MATNLHSVAYGRSEILFHLNFKPRKTLAIHVYPDCSVVVDAPANTNIEKIKTKVIVRAKWIRAQQRYFSRCQPELPAHKYVSGEAFRYLGKQYTLSVKQHIVDEVKLLKGQIHVCATHTNSKYIKNLLETWFTNRAKIILEERFIECLKHVQNKIGVEYNSCFILKRMKTRWGSCSSRHKIYLNPELIAASKDCIDYVIIHELCHLVEHNHSVRFYKLLEKILPEWKKLKDKLETTIDRRSL